MISQDSIQQIQNRIDIVDIVGSFVKLKRRGVNYLGLCPFHNEKTPSFTVSPSKEIYKCFGCGRSGNAIGFLMEHEKYSFVEAIRWLAEKYGIELEETTPSPEAAAERQLTESLFIVNHFAQEYFTSTLLESEEGRNIGQSYFQKRGFTEETMRKFQLGYCKESWDDFSTEALKKGYKLDYLQKTGLTVVRNERPRDNYRGRVIFPIHNQSGKVVGFGARILKKNDKAPKYINTPENEIYEKRRLLYGIYFARHAIDKTDECLLVEGYTDVISLHQAGMENVVASSGTSLTEDQLRLIKKYTRNLTILYDGDPAGIKAALRGLDMALEESLNVKLVLLPEGEDPDSYVQKAGPRSFREFIAGNKKDFILFKLQVSLGEVKGDPTKKAGLVNEIAETLSRINKAEDFTKQQDYIRECSRILEIDEEGLTTLVNQYIRRQIQKKRFKKPAGESRKEAAKEEKQTVTEDESEDLLSMMTDEERQEKDLVRVLLEHGEKMWDTEHTVAEYIFHSSLNFNLIQNHTLRQILSEYKKQFDSGHIPDEKFFIYHIDQEISKLAVNLLYTPYEISPNWLDLYKITVPAKEDLYKQDVKSAFNHLMLKMVRQLINQNQKDLNNTSEMEEQRRIMEVHQQLKKTERQIADELGLVIRK